MNNDTNASEDHDPKRRASEDEVIFANQGAVSKTMSASCTSGKFHLYEDYAHAAKFSKFIK